MTINISKDIATLKEYAKFNNYKTTGILRGSDGGLRLVIISNESAQIAIISNIFKELFNHPSVSTINIEEYLQLIDLANKFSVEKSVVKKSVIQRIVSNNLQIWDVGAQFINDKDVVIAAVGQNGNLLQCVYDGFKNDKEVVLAAFYQNETTLRYASNELRNNKDFMHTAVQRSGDALAYASVALKNDKKVVLAAVRQIGYALRYASEELRNDKEVVLAAVHKDGGALQYASDLLKNDQEVVVTAVRKRWVALKYANILLKHDKRVMLAAVRQNGGVLWKSSVENDPMIVLAAQIYHNPSVDIQNLSLGQLFEGWYSHLNNHENLPLCKKIIEIFEDPKFRDFEKKQILMNLFDLMIFLKDEVLQSHSASRIIQAIFTLAHPLARGELIDEFNQLSLSELKAISPQTFKENSSRVRFELRTKILLTRLNSVIGKPVFMLNIAETIYLNFLKDTKIQVVLFSYLKMVVNIYLQLNEHEQNKLILQLKIDLNKPLQLDLITKFKQLICIEAIFGKETMIEAINKTLVEIEAYFTKEFNKLFQGKSINKDLKLSSEVASRYQETFAQFREPMAIFTYLKSVKQVEPKVYEALSEYVYHVLKGDFDQFRNEQVEDQPHLVELYQKKGVKELWLTAPQSVELTDSGMVKALNIVLFFHQKVVIDNHFQDEDASQPKILKEYLEKAANNAIVDHQLYLRILEKDQANLDPNILHHKVLLARYRLEVLIIMLCAKEIDLETFKTEREALYSDGLVNKNEVEKALSNDFELLHQEALPSTSETNYTLQFTTDHNDLLLLGTEVQGSCQNINGQSNLNKCLLGYMINGESQAIVIKDSTKKIVGRGVIRLLLDDQGNPVLFLERLYLNKYLDSWIEAIISMAQEKAKIMGVPLLSKEVGAGEAFCGALHFIGGRAPFIYSDASGGVLNGQQGFITYGAHILFNPK